tara:strand:- start:1255 stop:1359 length:105 start_codon:yes stop_codon:yes gene_type:complete
MIENIIMEEIGGLIVFAFIVMLIPEIKKLRKRRK